MLVKKPIAIEGKKLFGFIILGSALIHFLVIFFLPAGKTTRENLYKTLQGSSSGSISLEIEVSQPVEEKQLLAPKEEPKEEKEAPEEALVKRQQFVDTGASETDEEVKVETEKVGEKGTLARDTVAGGGDEHPRLEGTTEAPSLGGVPGEAQGPTEPSEGEVSNASVAENTPGEAQEEVPGVGPEAPPGEEGKAEEMAATEVPAAVPEAVPTPQEPISEPLAQGPELVEKGVESPAQEVAQGAKESELQQPEIPEIEKLATSAERPETQAPIEDKDIPLLTDKGRSPGVEEETPLEKELRKLEVKEDGLIPIPRKEPQELAYVPPWELKGKVEDSARPQARTSAKTPAKRKPRVAISFNAKTLSGGEIMPMMDAAEANAPGEGTPSFNVRKDENGPYYRHIRDRISWYWYLGYGTRQEIKLETENNKPIIVEFKVYPEGMVKEVKIIQEAGNHLLASRIKDSIEATRLERFSRFGVKEEYIDVRFNFYFF